MTELEYSIKNNIISTATQLCKCAYKIKNDIGCFHIQCYDCEFCNNRELILQTLLAEHKEKIKLTQFEYDLITMYPSTDNKFIGFRALVSMKEKGYFKNIDKEMRLSEILENCEVVK